MSDDNTGIGLTRRRLLAGLGTLGAASAASGAGTFAYFHDTGTSNNNTIHSGTLKLNIHDSGHVRWDTTGLKPGQIQADSNDVFFENTGSVAASSFSMSFSNTDRENNGSSSNLTYSNGSVNESALTPGPASDTNTTTRTGSTGSDPGALGMAKWVRVWDMSYDTDTTNSNSSSIVTLVQGGANKHPNGHDLTDANGNGWIDLQDLADPSNASALSGFVPPESGNTPNNYSSSGPPAQTNLQLKFKLADETPNKYQGDVVFTNVTFTLNQ